MNDIEAVMMLFNKNHINYRVSEIYGETREDDGHAVWLDTGHIEFDKDGMIQNIVTY